MNMEDVVIIHQFNVRDIFGMAISNVMQLAFVLYLW